jgi:hypothetical protein
MAFEGAFSVDGKGVEVAVPPLGAGRVDHLAGGRRGDAPALELGKD